MKKIFFAIIVLSAILFSCNQASKKEDKQTSDSTAKKTTMDTVKLYDAQGNYLKDTVIVNQ